MNKKLIIFMPSIEGGGVEKNLFIISNFLRKKKFDIKLITSSKYHIKKFHGIQLKTPRPLYFICSILSVLCKYIFYGLKYSLQ